MPHPAAGSQTCLPALIANVLSALAGATPAETRVLLASLWAYEPDNDPGYPDEAL